MANYLITGSRGENHVTSNDAKAFNRSYFGNGKYILDGDELGITIYPQSGSISFSGGSLLWNGMQIRLTQSEIAYTPPAALSTVKVYFHYTKSSGVESVTAEAFVDSDPTPIIDNPQETAVSAYTLFMSFSANATSYANLVYAFSKIDPMSKVKELIAASTERTLLFNGEVALYGSISLNEAYSNFEELEFVGKASDICKGSVLTEYISNSEICVPMFGCGKFSNAEETYVRSFPALLKITDAKTLTFTNANSALIGTGIQSADKTACRILKIYGIRRK